MFNLLYSIILIAGLVSAPTLSEAATIDFGVIAGTSGNDSRSWMNSVSGSFTDYALFSTTTTTDISASITNSFAASVLFINGLTFSLYEGSMIGSGALVTSFVSTDANTPPGTQNVDLTALGQNAGNYYLSVSGTTADSPSYGGSLAISVSSVPLPASASMFGTALLGLAGLGYAAKRKKAAAAA